MPEWFAHETAIIDAGARIGAGTKIWHWTHVSGTAVIGEDCSLGQNVYVGENVCIGNGVKIQNNVSIYEGVIIEDDVFCGPSCVFTNVVNPRSAVSRKSDYRPTLVQRGSTIGANATVVCGNTLGQHAFVAAGSVVTKDVAPYGLVMGNPARWKAVMCRCGVKLMGGGRIACSSCGSRYDIDGASCVPLD